MVRYERESGRIILSIVLSNSNKCLFMESRLSARCPRIRSKKYFLSKAARQGVTPLGDIVRYGVVIQRRKRYIFVYSLLLSNNR